MTTAVTTPVLKQLLASLDRAEALPPLDSVAHEALIQAATSAAPAVVGLAVRDGDVAAGTQAGDNEYPAPLIVVTSTGGDAETFTRALEAYLDPAKIAIFP